MKCEFFFGRNLCNRSIMSIVVNFTNNESAYVEENSTDAIDRHQEIPLDISIVGACAGIVIILLGGFGNILLVVSVFSKKHKASNIFITSLAMCDFFQTVFITPLYVYTYFTRQWQLGPYACLFALYGSNIAILESILHVCAIAFYRFLIIVHPKICKNLPKRLPMIVLLITIYVLPLLIIFIPAGRRFAQKQALGVTVEFHPKIMFCSLVRSRSSDKISGIIKKVIFLLCAAAFLAFCYFRICWLVRESGRKILVQGGCSQTRLRREFTLLKTVVIIFVSFVACYLPISIIYAVDGGGEISHWMYLVGVLLLWCSSSINWIIYGVVNTQYRHAYRYLICGRNGAPSPSDNNNSSRLSRNFELTESRRSYKEPVALDVVQLNSSVVA